MARGQGRRHRRRPGRRGSRGPRRRCGNSCADGLREVVGDLGSHQVDRAAGPAAPESLPPRKPGADSADSIRASSAGELFSKSSRLDACEADISRPNAPMSPTFRASTPEAHALVFAQYVPGPFSPDRVELVPFGLELFACQPGKW